MNCIANVLTLECYFLMKNLFLKLMYILKFHFEKLLVIVMTNFDYSTKKRPT